MLTQQLLGTDDPDLRRNAGPFAQPAVLYDLFTYFRKVAKSRRARPTDDLASAIANARIEGVSNKRLCLTFGGDAEWRGSLM
ncbi:hypothetical protein ABZ721_23600 [Streptomyces sp. NPDC006733]|uniref:hypothetical protein n=1 Tax=Streptomyces sp. NPDC006733 TaxID=3155460 RepID=UPI0033EC614A